MDTKIGDDPVLRLAREFHDTYIRASMGGTMSRWPGEMLEDGHGL